MVANKYAFLQITRRRFLNEWEAFKKVISRRNIRRRITIPLTLSNLDRKSGSAGMPRPISYAVFCLKKKKKKKYHKLEYTHSINYLSYLYIVHHKNTIMSY